MAGFAVLAAFGMNLGARLLTYKKWQEGHRFLRDHAIQTAVVRPQSTYMSTSHSELTTTKMLVRSAQMVTIPGGCGSRVHEPLGSRVLTHCHIQLAWLGLWLASQAVPSCWWGAIQSSASTHRASKERVACLLTHASESALAAARARFGGQGLGSWFVAHFQIP